VGRATVVGVILGGVGVLFVLVLGAWPRWPHLDGRVQKLCLLPWLPIYWTVIEASSGVSPGDWLDIVLLVANSLVLYVMVDRAADADS
jgi:hypothetical protein